MERTLIGREIRYSGEAWRGLPLVSRTLRIARNPRESMPCTSSTKIEPDSRGREQGIARRLRTADGMRVRQNSFRGELVGQQRAQRRSRRPANVDEKERLGVPGARFSIQGGSVGFLP